MSRVEPEPQKREIPSERRSEPRRTPGQAEGDEKTVDEALRNQKQREPRME